MAPLLSASSSEAETLKMLVMMFVSCFTFSTYFCKPDETETHNKRAEEA